MAFDPTRYRDPVRAIGAVDDPKATDPSADASMISLFKGIFDAIRNAPVRTRLTNNLTLYVRPDGSDVTGDGLLNTAGSAFATRLKAWDELCDRYEMNGHNVTIQIADGTYTDTFITSKMPAGWNGTNSVVFRGNPTTPANVVISPPTGNCFMIGFGSEGKSGFEVNGMKLLPTAISDGNGLVAAGGGASIAYRNIDFGQMSGYHLLGNHGAFIYFEAGSGGGTYAVSGGALAHACANTGSIVAPHSATIVFSNNPAFTWFALANNGMIYINGVTWTNKGTVTGAKFWIPYSGGQIVASLSAPGSDVNYLPGNTAGILGIGTTYDSFLEPPFWADYTPTVIAQTPGVTPPTFTVNRARWAQKGKVVFLYLDITTTAQGTAAGWMRVSIPVAGVAGGNIGTVGGSEIAAAGYGVHGYVNDTLGLSIVRYDAIPVMVTGHRIIVSGSYEAA